MLLKKHLAAKLAATGAVWLAAWLFARHRRDADSSISASNFVRKDNRCYRVDLLASGSSRSTLVDDALCDSAPDITF